MQKILCHAALISALFFPGLANASDALKPSALSECADALCLRQNAVNSVVARLRVTLHDRAKSKDYELSGAYLGDSTGNLRLRVTTESGQLVLDLGMRGENVAVCIPGKELYLEGTREELLERPLCQLTLLAQCGRARDLFFPCAPVSGSGSVGRDACCINGRAYFNIAETQSVLPRYTTRLTAGTANATVEQMNIFSRGGADAGRVVYSRYHFLESGGTSKPAYPGRVTLHAPGGLYVLDMDVEDFAVNTPIAPGKFAVPLREGFKRGTLAAALSKNINIWDQ